MCSMWSSWSAVACLELGLQMANGFLFSSISIS